MVLQGMTGMLRYCVVQYDMVKCDVMCHGVLFDDTVCSVLYDMEKCGMMCCSVRFHDMVCCGVV